MRIGLLLPALPAYSETFFRSKISGLIESGDEVVLFVPMGKGEQYEGAQVVHQRVIVENSLVQIFLIFMMLVELGLRRPFVLKNFIKYERKSKRSWRAILENIYINAHVLLQKLDWLHFGFATMGLRRENVGLAIGAKVAASFRGYDVALYPLNHRDCYNLLWNKIDKVHTISTDLLEKAYRLGLSREVPVVKITPAIKAHCFLFDRLFIDDKKLSILTIGRLHWKKGLEYTLEALAIFKKGGYSFHYTIVGEGEELERLVFAAHQLGIAEQVTFLGKLPHEQIPAVMQKHDVYIQYSLQEGFCNAVLEAQAAGLLCIVSDAEGLSENVLDAITGWVVKRRNPAALAEKIMEVFLLTSSEKKTISLTSANRISKEFDVDKQRKRFLEFYHDTSNNQQTSAI